MLKELGFTNVYVVPEQELPDGDFVRIGNEELLTCGAEILVPAALENTISKSNAGNVRALAVISPERVPAVKQVPAITESP